MKQHESNVIFVNFDKQFLSRGFVLVLEKFLVHEDEHENEDE